MTDFGKAPERKQVITQEQVITYKASHYLNGIRTIFNPFKHIILYKEN